MSSPRDWQPEDDERWRREADDAPYRRMTHQLYAAIRWAMVMMLVVGALVVLVQG